MTSILIILSIITFSIYFFIYINKNIIGEKLKVIDIPNEKRKIHKKPVPKTASYSIAIIFYIYFLTFFNDLKSKDLHIIFIGPLLFFL